MKPSKILIKNIVFLFILFYWTGFSQKVEAKLKEGAAFPELKVSEFPGSAKFDSKLIKGKVVIVDFWASWCEPCKVELPALNKLYLKYKDKGLVVVGVNVDDDPKDAKAFLAGTPVEFPLVFDKGKKMAESIGVEKMPTSFILSKAKIVKMHEAFHSGDDKKMETEILALLK